MTEAQMPVIAELLARTLRGHDDPAVLAAVRADVAALCADYVPYPG
jgi:glycine/serine hydroxymethyltransferase